MPCLGRSARQHSPIPLNGSETEMTDDLAGSREGADQRCRTCEEPIDLNNNSTCSSCESVHCPFCGMASHVWRDGTFDIQGAPCPHLIASYCRDADDWDAGPPLDAETLPRLASTTSPEI